METVDGIGHAEIRLEQRLDALRIGQISFGGDDVLGALGMFRLDDIA